MFKKLSKIIAVSLILFALFAANIGIAEAKINATTDGAGPPETPAAPATTPTGPVYGPPEINTAPLAAVFDDLEECIEKWEADNYIVVQSTTIFDEDTGDTGIGDEFVARTCYENLFRYNTPDGTEVPLIKLAKKCGDQKAYELIGNVEYKSLKPTFRCNEVQVLLSKGGTTLIEGYIGMMYRWGASLAGIIAILVIVISGIQLSASGGESQAVEDAKTRIIKSIAGLAVLFLSGLILYTINPNFFVQ